MDFQTWSRILGLSKVWGALVWVFFLTLSLAHSHQNHIHKKESQTKASPESASKQAQMKMIQKDYIKTVQPIFEKKCLACHGGIEQKPWYYVLPGARQLINRDIAVAKEHLDMSNGFPFAGHGSTEEDLEAIQKSIKDGSMPPLRYRILHSDSHLTPEDQAKVIDWTEKSQKLLKTEKIK